MSKIDEKFKKYKLKPSNQKMEEICRPSSFKLQPQQLFLRDYFTSKLSNKGILVFHQIGAGKTCTAITMAEEFKNKMDIIVVLPAALIGNFKDELRGSCGGYMTDSEKEELKELSPKDKLYSIILEKADKRIDEYYTIYSYHKFVELCEDNKIKLKNTLLIIDEVQNMISDNGPFYRNLHRVIEKSDDKTRLILLSATPMFDRPDEIALMLNLLKIKKELPIGNEFYNKYVETIQNDNNYDYKMKNIEDFSSHLKNLISYYRGAPPQTYPKTIFNVVRCKMEPFQYNSYKTITEEEETGKFMSGDILKLPVNFLLGPRMISNIAFPNKGIGEKGFSSLSGKYLKKHNMLNYSKKFYKIINKINKAAGPTFVYSNFKDIGGIRSFVKFLEYNGYKDYRTYGEGKKRFAIWSGDEPHKVKEEIKYIFNKKENIDGNSIKIMLGSPSIKEGVSLLRVSQVHIMEPYWNMSRMLQIIGRAIRFCSHKDVPKIRRQVEVFLYLSTYPGEKTTDEYIWSLAKKKHALISQFEKVLKENAIDCKLFYHRNVYKNEEPLKCKN
jgi:superfamily II DNA or RNA helicase